MTRPDLQTSPKTAQALTLTGGHFAAGIVGLASVVLLVAQAMG